MLPDRAIPASGRQRHSSAADTSYDAWRQAMLPMVEPVWGRAHARLVNGMAILNDLGEDDS
jgi:hypothetical protein